MSCYYQQIKQLKLSLSSYYGKMHRLVLLPTAHQMKSTRFEERVEQARQID